MRLQVVGERDTSDETRELANAAIRWLKATRAYEAALEAVEGDEDLIAQQRLADARAGRDYTAKILREHTERLLAMTDGAQL